MKVPPSRGSAANALGALAATPVAAAGDAAGGTTPWPSLLLLAAFAFVLARTGLRGLRRLGRMPGDLPIEREGFAFYLPLTSGLLVGLLLSALLRVIAWSASSLPSPAGPFGWVGRLPGDVVVRGDGFTLFAPITSTLLLGLLLGAVVSFLSWLARRGRGGEDEDGADRR